MLEKYISFHSLTWIQRLEHIPKFRNGTGKILANALTPDFSGASDIILGYGLRSSCQCGFSKMATLCLAAFASWKTENTYGIYREKFLSNGESFEALYDLAPVPESDRRC
jgi:hypothetical protein